MKMMGAQIEYCSSRRSYYYSVDKVLAIGFVDPSKVRGGKNLTCPVFSDNLSFYLDKEQEFQVDKGSLSTCIRSFKNSITQYCSQGYSPNPLIEEVSINK